MCVTRKMPQNCIHTVNDDELRTRLNSSERLLRAVFLDEAGILKRVGLRL